MDGKLWALQRTAPCDHRFRLEHALLHALYTVHDGCRRGTLKQAKLIIDGRFGGTVGLHFLTQVIKIIIIIIIII